MNFTNLIDFFKNNEVKRVFIKSLAPNDNSKNQPYFGGDLSVLNVLPAGELVAEQSCSSKPSRSKTRFKAPLEFFWVDEECRSFHAPNAQLIFYPQYPEMRFSGFLRGAEWGPSELMDPNKRGRELGRSLIMGTTSSGRIYAYVADSCTHIQDELSSFTLSSTESVLQEIEWLSVGADSEKALLYELKRIHSEGWIAGKRLLADGGYIDCNVNPNCGGYTLEAELGVSANGYAEPDYLGWEIKQYSVSDFESNASHIITLMTPEPDAGIYADEGVLPFIKKFGYPDRNGKPDRQNFGGVFKFHKPSALTGLRLELIGYDSASNKISDSTGGIALVSANDEIASMWSYSKLIDHWKRKHAKTAYIPSMRTEKPYSYFYGKDVTLCKGTDFMLFLNAIVQNSIYIDPAIKAENFSTESPRIKRRNQIRVSFKNVASIYHSVEKVDCTSVD